MLYFTVSVCVMATVFTLQTHSQCTVYTVVLVSLCLTAAVNSEEINSQNTCETVDKSQENKGGNHQNCHQKPSHMTDHLTTEQQLESYSRRLLPPLQNKPMQLVRPDVTHNKMELVQENIQSLLRLTNPVAVVAVVGKYHSGKSFLLNQLMGKEGSFGFTVGPSLRPQTMGIWMWGKPTTMTLPSGQDISVIFLDTEGFAANNVSERYDAKVFAVAALLSSYLIYNSVKVIDQADLDYLELLSRRTQLFALRSQLSRAQWAKDFNHDLLSFPPLLWVIQDFVQVVGNDEPTPSEWLHEMMTSSTWENENHRISLLDIFPDVNCHTLFFPATRKAILQDLSMAREEDLTAEYKVERDRLKRTLRHGLIPKEKNGRPITGAELASLIDVLVTSANEGSLSEIPSRWSSFIQSMEQSAVQDCLKFYDTEMMALHQRHDMGAIDEDELQQWHETSTDKTDRLLQQVLFGLGEVVKIASADLQNDIGMKYERTVEMNDKKIKLRCSEVQHRAELEGESSLSELSLPVRTSQLLASYASIKAECVQSYTRTLHTLIKTTSFQKFLEQLKTSLDNIRDAFVLKNVKLLQDVLELAGQKCLDDFDKRMQSQHQDPHTPKVMQRLVRESREKALSLFLKEAKVAEEEATYSAHSALVRSRLSEAEESHFNKNNERLKIKCQKEVNMLVQSMRDNTDSTQLPLPVNDTDLDHRLTQETTRVKTLFKELLDDFSSMTSYDECLMELQRLIHAVCGQRRQENMEAYTREVEVPLQSAKKIALLSADKYNTVFSLTTFIREVCMLNLDEGKPKHWPTILKASIVDLFMISDPDIRRVIKDREGLWSTVMGFIQWIAWVFS